MVDPRTTIINQRLSGISKIIAVSSGKGGVGKSLVATTLALTLAEKGCKVGLFDLDFTSPSTHLLLNVDVEQVQPKEDRGLVPPNVHGLEYMSLVYYSKDQAAPLRGTETTNALIELLSVTQWGKLDYLIVDMPPGIGDTVLDLISLIQRIQFVIVTTPSQLAFETVKKLANLLQDQKIHIIGVVENMKMAADNSKIIEQQTEKLGMKFLAQIPYDFKVEDAIGNPKGLLETAIARKICEVVTNNYI